MSPPALLRRMADEGPVEDARVFPGDGRALTWFVKNRYVLWEGLVEEAQHEREDPVARQARFDAALKHAKRVLVARLVVTILLAFGVIASVASALIAVATVPGFEEGAAAADRLFELVAAYAGSASVALLAVRFALERALTRYDVVASFLAPRLTRVPPMTRP